MLKVNAKVKANTAGISSKIRKIANDKGLGTFLAETAAKGMDRFVPWRTGALASSVTVSPFKVTYNAPYAVYVYNGRSVRLTRNQHPLATPHWDRAYDIVDGQKLAKAGTDYLKGR